MIRKLLPVALASATLLGAACGGGSGNDEAIDAAVARTTLIEHLHDRGEAAAAYSWARTLEEMLPNVAFQPPGRVAVQPVRQAVVGDVVDVEPGRAFRNQARGTTDRPTTLDDFDDPTADWRTLHLEVEVVESLGDEVGRRTLRVGLPVSGYDDPRILIEGAKALGRVVLLLDDAAGDLYAYDRSVVGMVLGGQYLATVADDGALAFPVLEASEAEAFQGELRTLDDLRRAAAEPTTVIPLAETAPGFFARTDAG